MSTTPKTTSPSKPNKASTPDSRRKALLAQIHIVRKQLVDAGVMDDDGYRAALRDATTSKFNVAGKDSLKLMSEYDLKDSLRHLQKLARLHQLGNKTQASNDYHDARPLERKLWAVWTALGHAGKLETPGAHGLYAFVKNRTDVERPRWCTDAQLNSLIEQAKQWGKRYEPTTLPNRAASPAVASPAVTDASEAAPA